MVSIDWPQALAWRMRRHGLEPIGDGSVADVVGRVAAIQSGSELSVELAIRTRQELSSKGEISRALDEGEIIRTFAFRGATHLMTPEDAGPIMALRASSRMWELPSWQEYYRLKPSDWPRFREAVRTALADGPLTRRELGAAVVAHPEFAHLRFVFEDQNWTLLKPLAWQGDMCFGPSRDGQATFQALEGNPRWSGLPDLDEAGMRAIESYVHSYGPATSEHIQYWLGAGLGAARKRLRSWIAAFGERLATIDVEGEPAFILRDDIDELAATEATTAVRLLPAYDPWVLGPGTTDPHVVPPHRRTPVTRGANIVIAGGVVSGTWSLKGDQLAVNWFPEAGPSPRNALAQEVGRLGAILDRPLELSGQTG